MTPHPEILTFTDYRTTAAVAGNTTSYNILGAPGANQRYRIFAVMASERPTHTGNIQIRVLGSAFSTTLATLGIDQNSGAGIPFYPQGIPMEENQAIGGADRSDVASQDYYITIHYVIETI